MDGVVWSVGHGVEIAGTVRTRDGQPVAEAWVRASVAGGDPRGQRTWGSDTTDEQGQFSMKGLVAGTYDVHSGAPDHPQADEPTRVDATKSKRVELELTADVGGTIVGTVLDETGKPMAGLRVTTRAER